MWQLIALLASAFAEPAYPLWPNQFTQTFNETTSLFIGSHHTTGTYYYDWTNRKYRVDRANGRNDRYCGLNGVYMFFNTPCSHYVSEGKRYLYYPNRDHCCFCCDDAQGCGVLKPTWLEGAEYLGEEQHLGFNTYKWNQKGLQNNFYYETVASNPVKREMISLYQEPNDLMDFLNGRQNSVPAGALDLPDTCKDAKACSLFSTCSLVRHS